MSHIYFVLLYAPKFVANFHQSQLGNTQKEAENHSIHFI